MRRMFDFFCDNGHVTERLVDDSVGSIICPQCGKDAVKAVSAPSIKLEGFTGAFPDAYDRWARVRAEKLQQEKKQNS